MKILKQILIATVIVFTVSNIQAQVKVGVAVTARIAPPALPVFVQPACPVDGYLWQPGYWAWNSTTQEYYWIPGVWVAPPRPRFLWTPPYWGFEGGLYGFHAGYWGLHVGFYGGINYGCGYWGRGFAGGRWYGHSFHYNTAVLNVNKSVVHNTYEDKTVINKTTVNNHISFNGPNGVTAKPSSDELKAMKEDHVNFTKDQQTHENTARADANQSFAHNHGTPERMSMDKVGGHHFNGAGHRI